MVERALSMREVAGSMPASSNTKYFQHNSFRKAKKNSLASKDNTAHTVIRSWRISSKDTALSL